MNILLNAIDKAIGSSSEAGTIHIRRFSLYQYGVKRFSSNGDLISSENIKERPVSTEEIVDILPDNSEVAVFSDETTGIEDVVTTIDGGDLDEEIAEACDSGYKEDTKKFSADIKWDKVTVDSMVEFLTTLIEDGKIPAGVATKTEVERMKKDGLIKLLKGYNPSDVANFSNFR